MDKTLLEVAARNALKQSTRLWDISLAHWIGEIDDLEFLAQHKALLETAKRELTPEEIRWAENEAEFRKLKDNPYGETNAVS